MTTDSSRTTEIQPDPRLEKRTRRRFSAAEKLRLVTEADGTCQPFPNTRDEMSI